MVVSTLAPGRAHEVAWHRLECGAYRADLALWSELAAEHTGPLLEVGAGAGRVALHLVQRGHRVIALDSSPGLLAALREAAGEMDLRAVCADARAFELPERGELSLCIAPMQTLQLLGGARGRLDFLYRARVHLRPGGLLACAVVCDVEPFASRGDRNDPDAERLRIGSLLYTSRARRVALSEDEIVLERERTVEDELTGRRRTSYDTTRLDRVSTVQLWREARAVGFEPEPSRLIEATEEYAGSTVVMLRA